MWEKQISLPEIKKKMPLTWNTDIQMIITTWKTTLFQIENLDEINKVSSLKKKKKPYTKTDTRKV